MIPKLNDPTLLKSQCLIGGEWCGLPEANVTNPANGEVIATVPRMGSKEAQECIDAAFIAQKLWAKKTAKERANILRNWFNLIIANADDLALILTLEQGKPLAEAKGEILYAASFVEFFAEEAKRINGEIIPSPNANGRILVLREPLGVVAAITPWNFPAAMITRKLAPALAAGCAVVCKPAGETPLSAFALGELANRAGVPAGVLNIINGNSAQIGEVWCASPIVRGLSFTGSTEIGKLLMRQCADTVKKLALELGGNAAFLVFDDADLEAAAEGVMASKFRNTGQTCVCANRILVQAKIHDEFVAILGRKISALKVADGLESGATQGPLIDAKAIAKVNAHIADATSKGASIVIGGKTHAKGGNFFEPTLLTGATNAMDVAKEETFGPLCPIFKFETEEDGLAMANDTEFGLASYFYAKDLGRVFRIAEGLEAGIVGVNSGLISNEVAPFGGIKQSGLGREGSHHGIDEYTEIKYVYLGVG
ncbi:MAG: succinate-semialdehyde dehydrogenase (NADP+) [Hyphomonadaceae bacterium]|nr:MAG: succinate-semialdehyde dehydrogenase (NADP+) [Hyphomonadaceae bacterium]